MSRPLSLALYRVATAVLDPLAPALLRRRVARGKEEAARLGERLGHASAPRPPGPLAWLHGASVGESLSLLPLIDALRALRPDLAVLVTSGTVTSAELMARRLPPGVIHQYAPVDAPTVARRFLDHWRPDLVVFVESELWPNLLLGARARGARLALVSARMTQASAAGWARAPATARAVLGGFDLVLPQDDAAAQRLTALGAVDHGRLNLKLAGAPLPVDDAALEEVRRAAAGRPILLGASTHPGEDEIVLDAFAPLADCALLVIAPRHPVRGPDIVALAQARGLDADLRTQEPFGQARVHVADTLGELGLWFRAARGALVGGALTPGIGGHNPLEAIRLGCPVATGPHFDSWRGVYGPLVETGAAVVTADAPALEAAFARFLADAAPVGGDGDTGEAAVRAAAARLAALLP